MRDHHHQHDPIRNKLLNSLFGNFSSSCERPHDHHRHGHACVEYNDYYDDQDYYYYGEDYEEEVEQEQQPPQQLQSSSSRTRYEKRLPTIPEHHHPESKPEYDVGKCKTTAATPSSPTSVTKSLHLLVELEEVPEQDEALCSYAYDNNGDTEDDYYDHDYEYERYEPDNDDSDDLFIIKDEEENRTSHHQSMPTRTKRVSFQSSALLNTVILIPSFRDYTPEECSNMWNSRSEIKRAIHRNVVEFVMEGWDWRQALEEDQFLRLDNGELVHPAHVPHDGNNHHSSSSSSSLSSLACHHHHHHATHHHHNHKYPLPHDQHQHHSKHRHSSKHHYLSSQCCPPPAARHQHPCLPVFPTMVVTPISKPTSGGGGVTVDNAS